jgi:hypothetical protein
MTQPDCLLTNRAIDGWLNAVHVTGSLAAQLAKLSHSYS